VRQGFGENVPPAGLGCVRSGRVCCAVLCCAVLCCVVLCCAAPGGPLTTTWCVPCHPLTAPVCGCLVTSPPAVVQSNKLTQLHCLLVMCLWSTGVVTHMLLVPSMTAPSSAAIAWPASCVAVNSAAAQAARRTALALPHLCHRVKPSLADPPPAECVGPPGDNATLTRADHSQQQTKPASRCITINPCHPLSRNTHDHVHESL
jgi:hypothetical protein